MLGLYVDGVKPSLIHEPIASYARAADVHPIRIPGYWQHASSLNLPKPAPQLIMGQPPLPGEKVVYFLHGGGWVSHSAHPSSPLSRIPLYLMEFCAEIGVPVHRAFALEYRLSADAPEGYGKSRAGGPGTPFPAMLLDALAGYVYLVREVGFKPEQIVVVGDSAGGHLALALVRYLVDYQPQASARSNGNSGAVATSAKDREFPGLPGGVLLMSPATNLSGTPARPGTSYHANASSDFITVDGSGNPGFRNVFLAGPLGVSGLYTNLYLSPSAPDANTPKYADGGRGFANWPKTFLSAGDAELILTMIRDLEKLMKAEMGERLVYLEAEDSVHDYTAWPSNEPQRTRDLKVMAKWIADL